MPKPPRRQPADPLYRVVQERDTKDQGEILKIHLKIPIKHLMKIRK